MEKESLEKEERVQTMGSVVKTLGGQAGVRRWSPGEKGGRRRFQGQKERGHCEPKHSSSSPRHLAPWPGRRVFGSLAPRVPGERGSGEACGKEAHAQRSGSMH